MKSRTISLYIGRDVDVETKPYTDERAEDILRLSKPFLDSQRRYWRERIIKLFKFYTTNAECSFEDLQNMKVEHGGLRWQFHIDMLIDMCSAWEEKGSDPFADRDVIIRK